MKVKNTFSLIILVAISGCQPSNKAVNEPIKKNKAWCVNVCIEDIFQDMHSSGESWGTSSSSMNGLSEQGIFTNVKNYCSNIYKDSCIKTPFMSDNEIHYSGGKGAGVMRGKI